MKDDNPGDPVGVASQPSQAQETVDHGPPVRRRAWEDSGTDSDGVETPTPTKNKSGVWAGRRELVVDDLSKHRHQRNARHGHTTRGSRHRTAAATKGRGFPDKPAPKWEISCTSDTSRGG